MPTIYVYLCDMLFAISEAGIFLTFKVHMGPRSHWDSCFEFVRFERLRLSRVSELCLRKRLVLLWTSFAEGRKYHRCYLGVVLVFFESKSLPWIQGIWIRLWIWNGIWIRVGRSGRSQD